MYFIYDADLFAQILRINLHYFAIIYEPNKYLRNGELSAEYLYDINGLNIPQKSF